jgi:anti-sigma factor RsiW
VIEADRWEVLERIGAYAAGELMGEEARETESLILENPEVRRLAASYISMMALLGAIGQETPEPPEVVVNRAIRRAYVSAFFRQTENLFGGVGRAYFDAFVYYLGLRGGEAADVRAGQA